MPSEYEYWYEKLPYDTHKDRELVITNEQTRNLLVIRTAPLFQSINNLASRGISEINALSYSSAENCSTNHVTME